jgi:uncharacterized membrane protein YeaQ/YmgE (transglycosylase-associated protein family)
MTITLPSVHLTLPNSIELGSSDLIVLLIVGLIAGFLASRAVGVGGGLLLDMAVGVIGAFLGRWLFAFFGVSLGSGIIPEIIVAFVGAAFLLLIVRALSGGYGSRRRLS